MGVEKAVFSFKKKIKVWFRRQSCEARKRKMRSRSRNKRESVCTHTHVFYEHKIKICKHLWLEFDPQRSAERHLLPRDVHGTSCFTRDQQIKQETDLICGQVASSFELRGFVSSWSNSQGAKENGEAK